MKIFENIFNNYKKSQNDAYFYYNVICYHFKMNKKCAPQVKNFETALLYFFPGCAIIVPESIPLKTVFSNML